MGNKQHRMDATRPQRQPGSRHEQPSLQTRCERYDQDVRGNFYAQLAHERPLSCWPAVEERSQQDCGQPRLKLPQLFHQFPLGRLLFFSSFRFPLCPQPSQLLAAFSQSSQLLLRWHLVTRQITGGVYGGLGSSCFHRRRFHQKRSGLLSHRLLLQYAVG